MKLGKQIGPKIGISPDFLFWGYFPLFTISRPICFPIFILGPISGAIWFPILGRRPETYFLAGRLDRNPGTKKVPTVGKKIRSAFRFWFDSCSILSCFLPCGSTPLLIPSVCPLSVFLLRVFCSRCVVSDEVLFIHYLLASLNVQHVCFVRCG